MTLCRLGAGRNGARGGPASVRKGASGVPGRARFSTRRPAGSRTRASRRTERTIAFIDHPGSGDDGTIAVVDRSGKKTDLAGGWSTVQGLAWAPGGREIWFTAARQGIEREIWAVTASGQAAPGPDDAGDAGPARPGRHGNALVTEDDYRSSVLAFLPGQADGPGSGLVRLVERSRPVRRREASSLRRIGRGRRRQRVGAISARPTDRPAVRLCDGVGVALSPDTAWALTRTSADPSHFVLVPVKAGQPREFPPDGLGRPAVRRLPSRTGRSSSSKRAAPGHGTRLYVQARRRRDSGADQRGRAQRRADSSSRPTALGRGDRPRLSSPPLSAPAEDRRAICAASRPDDYPAGWTADGKGLYVSRRRESLSRRPDRHGLGPPNRTCGSSPEADAAGVTSFGPGPRDSRRADHDGRVQSHSLDALPGEGPEMTLAAGTKVGPYEVLGLLGAGGMGEVYRARDERLKRDVAVKVLPAIASRGPRAAAPLRAGGPGGRRRSTTPTSRRSTTSATHEGSPYVVTELLEGETLRARLSGGALPARKAIDYAIQIAQGLAAAHEKGIVHRDLKPENLFVTNDGRVKILDFGLAKLTQADGAARRRRRTCRPRTGTEPGVVLGTLGYMSPEQVQGQAGRRALGHLLVRRRPLRDALGHARLPPRLGGRDDVGDPARGPAGPLGDEQERRAGARARRAALPREESRGALPLGARPGVRPRGPVGDDGLDRGIGGAGSARPHARRPVRRRRRGPRGGRRRRATSSATGRERPSPRRSASSPSARAPSGARASAPTEKRS